MDEQNQSQAGGDSLQNRMNQAGQGGEQPPTGYTQGQPPQDLPGAPAQQQTPPSVPAPEPRTMQSDMAGGANPNQTTTFAQGEQPINQGQSTQTFSPAGMDSDAPVFTPDTEHQTAVPVEPDVKGGHKGLWMVLGVLVGLFILGLIGYFFVYPMFAPVEEPIVEQPVVEEPQQPVVPPNQHTSHFQSEPTSRITVALGDTLSEPVITSALIRETQSVAMGVTEFIFVNANGTQVSAADFFSILTPEVGTAEVLGGIFEDDFTAFVYKNDQGVWPGYVLTLKPTASPEQLTLWLENIEGSNLNDFFMLDPGTFAEFRNGEVLGLEDRYAPGSEAGASFGYLANQGNVLLSTSFDGMKEALMLLGWGQSATQ